MSKVKVIPKLRFPEFTDDWQVKRLGDISSEVIDKVGDRNVETYSITAGVGFVSQTEKFGKDISGSQNPRYTMLSPNELSYNKGNSKTYQYGCVYRNPFDHEIAVPNVFISFKFSDGNSAGFYEQLFIGHYLDRYLRRIISSGARMDGLLNVGKRDFFDIKIPAPSKKEQEKIADFLTAVDEKIAKLEQKQTSLETYKRGVMQQIFSQKIRFTKPDGSNYPDWEAVKLSSFLSNSNGRKAVDINREKIITVRLHQRGVERNENTDTLSIGSTAYYVRRAGQFIYGKQNLFSGAFGIVPEELDGFVSSGDVPTLDIDSSRMDGRFLVQFMARDSFYRNLEKYASGSGSKRIHQSQLLSLEFWLPHIEEQQKIADFLSVIDSKIQLNNDIIQKAKQFKKSLLQRMFV